MKRSLIALLAGLGAASVAHAQEAPMDATHLGLRAFVYNAFTGVQKADEMPQYPKGALSKADLYGGVAAGIRARGKACAGVAEARALDANGEKIEVKCTGGGRYRVLPLTGEVQAA
ncbi:hypothetical protein ACQUJT_08090 [Ralstonia pseudosolanacearum]|uniref:Uncharacterized protein n=1 Tax=Ralstonia solanacearum TaxID=305 RepID=A0AA92JUT7_RALSL|nr:hypothetical protein [Ralstonia pseudosolanacearum]QOK93237.1 hypothetical protein HF908_18200 [Ralstonia pseudosolanacearum]QOK98134.1 hypothetical protein HF909_17925 [Ralstonia pseudosolanacearum]